MIHGWTKRDSKRLVSRRREKGEGSTNFSEAVVLHMGSGLHAETGCRKVYAGKVFQRQTNSMEAKETLGDGRGRNYTNSQSAHQNRRDAISRVSAQARLRRIAQEARGKNTDGLTVETYSHINSAGCEGMAMTVTAAHHSISRHLYTSMHATKNPKGKLKFVTLIKESNMSTLWRREVFLRICSEEDLSEKTQAIEREKGKGGGIHQLFRSRSTAHGKWTSC